MSALTHRQKTESQAASTDLDNRSNHGMDPGRKRRVVKSIWRASWLALLLQLHSPAWATYLYTWNSVKGPVFEASFQVADAAIADAVITASEILVPPGINASSTAGIMTQLTADSALGVDPATGNVVDSAHSMILTNAQDTVLLSAVGYFIPTSRLQSRGKGNWQVTHYATDPAPFRMTFLSYSRSQVILQVTASPDVPFTLEASADLVHWVPVMTSQTIGGTCKVSDSVPEESAARYYRAVATR